MALVGDILTCSDPRRLRRHPDMVVTGRCRRIKRQVIFDSLCLIVL